MWTTFEGNKNKNNNNNKVDDDNNNNKTKTTFFLFGIFTLQPTDICMFYNMYFSEGFHFKDILYGSTCFNGISLGQWHPLLKF
jgi:hypothetical protein